MSGFDNRKAAIFYRQKAAALTGDPLTARGEEAWQHHDEDGGDALTYLKLAVSLDPENSACRLDLYTAFREAGDKESAWHHLQEAFRKHPCSENARLDMINFLNSQRKYDEAAAVAQDGVQINPLSRTMWFALGHCRMQIKNYAGALEAYQNALDLESPKTLKGHERSEIVISAFEEIIRAGMEAASRAIAAQAIPDPFPRRN